MRTWIRNVALVGVLAVAALAFIHEPVRAAKTAELKIGFISALSGAGMGWGMGMLGGLEMAAEDVNKAGGIPIGDTTYTIKVIAYDDKYTGPGAVQAAQRLISQDGVNIIVGPLGSVPMLAIADVTESNKVLVFSNSYTTKALGPKKPHTFRLTPTSMEFSLPFLQWIAKNQPQLKTVAIVGPNDESGKEVASHNEAAYQKVGIKVLAKEFYERGSQDFVPLLTKLLASKPDILDLDGTTPGDSGVILKQARQMNAKVFIITRSRYRDQVQRFYVAGADVVVCEELEAGIEMGRYVLESLGIVPSEVAGIVDELRAFGSADFF